MISDEKKTEEIHLPKPSIWPAACGVGIALVGFGVVTTGVFSAVGLVVMAWSLAGWIGELCHD